MADKGTLEDEDTEPSERPRDDVEGTGRPKGNDVGESSRCVDVGEIWSGAHSSEVCRYLPVEDEEAQGKAMPSNRNGNLLHKLLCCRPLFRFEDGGGVAVGLIADPDPKVRVEDVEDCLSWYCSFEDEDPVEIVCLCCCTLFLDLMIRFLGFGTSNIGGGAKAPQLALR